MENKNTTQSLEKVIRYLEEKYQRQISPSSTNFFIATLENKENLLSYSMSPKTNKYRKTIGVPLKDASSYDTVELKGNIFDNYAQLDSGLVIPEEFAIELNRNYIKYTPNAKITHCINHHL